MNDIESVRDYLLADLIMEIESLSRKELVSELVEMKSREIESAPPEKLLMLCKNKKHDN